MKRWELQNCIDYISSFHPWLKYIYSTSLYHLIDPFPWHFPVHFLCCSFYRKLTDTYQYIMNESSRTSHTKNSLPYSRLLRFKNSAVQKLIFRLVLLISLGVSNYVCTINLFFATQSILLINQLRETLMKQHQNETHSLLLIKDPAYL